MKKRLWSGVLFGASLLLSCGRNDQTTQLTLDPLTKEQALGDFDQIVMTFKQLYGPLEYKATHSDVKLNFDEAVSTSRAAIETAKSDAEIFGYYAQFLKKFRDGHVSIRFPLGAEHVNKYTVPLFVMPIQDDAGAWHVVVDNVGDAIKDSGLKPGDEITKVDGKAILDYLPTIQKYKSFSNDVTDRHLIYKVFSRDFFMFDMIPTSPLVTVEFQSGDAATQRSTTLAWVIERGSSANPDIVKPIKGKIISVDMSDRDAMLPEGSLQKMGANEPFFATSQVMAQFKLHMRRPSPKSLERFHVTEKDAAPIWAATYEYKNKDILIIRQPGYVPPFEGNQDDDELLIAAINNWIQTYKAILYENENVDMVVIDQTHNPGGASTYVLDFFRLFISSPKANLIQKNNVDRKWILSFLEEAARADKRGKPTEARRNRAFAKIIEDAHDRGDLLSAPITFDYDFMLNPHPDYSWKKPVFVLADELAGSCGDIFPMLMKHNGLAKVFGQRTMGLGGNVQEFSLTSSQSTLRLTRGLFTTFRQDGVYEDGVFVENNGVTPHFVHDLRLNDYRAGFVGYFEALSNKAIEQL